MKILLTLACLLASSAYAEEATHPCAQIKQACEGAGFTKGGHKNGKGLYMDCVKKIMEGGSVNGVSVDAATVTACKERREAHKAKHAK